MTAKELAAKYRRHWMGFMAEAWACRRMPHAEFGQMIDSQMNHMERIIEAMALELGAAPEPSPNGAVPSREARPAK